MVDRSNARAPETAWPNGARGAVSITYDDGLDSQLDLAIPALDARDLKATFYVTMKNIEHRVAEWASLPSRGHELADHTMSHPCDLQRFAPSRFIEQQVAPMEDWLTSIDPPRRNPSFAYPCDVTNLGHGPANAQAHRYALMLRQAGLVAARTSEGEPNNPATLRRRAYRLQALAVGYDAPDLDAVISYLSLAEQRGHWAILVFHEISTDALQSGEVAPSMHDGILDFTKSSRLWPATIAEVLAHAM